MTVAREIHTAIDISGARLLENALRNFDDILDPSVVEQLAQLDYDQDQIVRILFSAVPFLSQDENEQLAVILGSEQTLQAATSELKNDKLALLRILIVLIKGLQSLEVISAHLQENVVPKFKPVVETQKQLA